MRVLVIGMQRGFDLVLGLLGCAIALPIGIVIAIVILVFDKAPPIFVQKRVGRDKKIFELIKFRTMKLEAPSIATHLIHENFITPIGAILRLSKLDELPQLWNVLRGEMSLVGPRPCLFDQQELIAERAARGVFDVRPGITGLAQIQGIDMSDIELLVKTESEMLQRLDIFHYFSYVFFTLLGKGTGDRVREKSS